MINYHYSMIDFKPLYLFSAIIFGSFIHTELVSVGPGCPKCGDKKIPFPFGMNSDGDFHKIEVFLGTLMVAPLLVATWIAWTDRQEKLQKLREDEFERNGGKLLQRKLSRSRNTQLSMYTVEDMKSITNNYSTTSHHMLRCCTEAFYRGTLPDDSEVEVAVVTVKRVPRSQLNRFVDQLIFLSQPHNKNLVRLIGCCLETNLPLLVYELRGDNSAAATLFDWTRDRELASRFSCQMRVKAAAGMARGLASMNMHGKIRTSKNMHGNICSGSIVMDNGSSFDAKIFYAAGSNLIIPRDISSSDQENYVYRDPEYIRSGRLNNKSDVYSFGVVLVELLRGGTTRENIDRNMVSDFVQSAKAGRLREILDEEMSAEADGEVVREIAVLAERCLNVKPSKRPDMKQVAAKLSMLMIPRE